MSELDQFLSELREDGKVESDGAFTVTLEVAEEKLQRFQLQNPQHYVVQMVATAVAAGSTFLHVRSDLAKIEFIADGSAPTAEELEQLSNSLFDTTGIKPYLAELAVGVHGAVRASVRKVMVESFTEEGSFRLELKRKEQKFMRIRGTSPLLPLLRVVFDKGFGLTTPLVNTHPELRLLEKYCHRAPLELLLNEESKSEPFAVPRDCLGSIQIRGSIPLAFELSRLVHEFEVDENSPTAAIFLAAPNEAHSTGLQLIHHGVLFERRNTLLGMDCLCGIASIPGLRKDISHSNLVENEVYQAGLEQLRAAGLHLLVEMCREPDALSGKRALVSKGVKKALEGELEPEQRQVLSYWLDYGRLATSRGLKDVEESLAKADDLHASGEVERAQQLRRKCIEKILQQLESEFDKLQLEKVQSLLELLAEPLAKVAGDLPACYVEAQLLVGCLSGQLDLEQLQRTRENCWSYHRDGLIYRYCGQHGEARRLHQQGVDLDEFAWGQRFLAELHLLRGQYQEAFELLSAAEKVTHSRDLLEELAFLTRFTKGGRGESARYLLRAMPAPDSDPHVRFTFLEWLVQDGRGVLPFDQYVTVRAQASYFSLKTNLLLGQREEIESALRPEFDLLGSVSLESARRRRVEAVEAAEESYGSVSAYTQFVRRRAVYQLHRLEAHQEADRLQCRGHMLAQLDRIWVTLGQC